jgi:sulfatase maturation enzyme AslB (radical SAM superfamily)
MDLSVISKNLQLDKLSSLRHVLLQGDKGDPCMNHRIDDFIDMFATHKNSPWINLVTNGSIRNQKWWQKLGQKKYHNLKVTFSIDGLHDTNHLYRIGLDFDDIINNARSFIDAGGIAEWKFILFQHNQHQIHEAKKLSEQLGFRNFSIALPEASRFKNQKNWKVIKDSETTYTISLPDITLPDNFKITNVDSKLLTSEPDNNEICPYLRNARIYLTASHKVIPCCMMHFDIDLDYFGRDYLLKLVDSFESIDLSIHSLESILNNEFYTKNLNQSFVTGKWHNTCVNSCRDSLIKNIRLVKRG